MSPEGSTQQTADKVRGSKRPLPFQPGVLHNAI